MSAVLTLRIACLLLLIVPATGCGAKAAEAPATPSAATSQAPAGWTLVFSDDFDGSGPPDSAKWGYELGYIRNHEAQYYTSRPENVRAESGSLVIEGRKEAHQGFDSTNRSTC